MISYLDKIRYLYPTIQRVSQFHIDNEGNLLGYDGIVWENPDIQKPTKEELDAIPDELVERFLEAEKQVNTPPSSDDILSRLFTAFKNKEIVTVEESATKLSEIKAEIKDDKQKILNEILKEKGEL